jgi:hypothetical protein
MLNFLELLWPVGLIYMVLGVCYAVNLFWVVISAYALITDGDYHRKLNWVMLLTFILVFIVPLGSLVVLLAYLSYRSWRSRR